MRGLFSAMESFRTAKRVFFFFLLAKMMMKL